MKYNAKNKKSSMIGGNGLSGAMKYNMDLFSILAMVGIIINVIFVYFGNNIATSTIWTYGFSILALCGITLFSFGNSTSGDGFFKKLLTTALPGILIIGILSAILYQNIAFFGQINEGKVPDEYYTYSGITSFLIIIQTIIVIKYLKNVLGGPQDNTESGSQMSSELYNINFIFTIANIGFISILQVILKLFSTGG